MATNHPDTNSESSEPLKELKQQADTIKDNLYEKAGIEPVSSLHTKLQAIIAEAHQAASERGRNDNYTVMLIEQAFKDEGWLSPDGKEKLIALTRHLEQQGFLGRFEAELDKLNPSMRLEAWNLVFEAARLAAGVSDE